jgi:hypothetical protein
VKTGHRYSIGLFTELDQEEVKKPRKAGASARRKRLCLRPAILRSTRPHRRSAWEEGSGSRSHDGGGENLRGQNTRRASAAGGFRSLAVRILRGEQNSEAPRLPSGFSGSDEGRERQESTGLERGAASRRGSKPCRWNPTSVTGMKQARTGVAGCKPSRARETLRTEGGG